MKLLTAIFLFVLITTIDVFAQVNIEKMRKDKQFNGWLNNIQSTIELDKGNSDDFKIVSKYRTDYISGNWYTFIIGSLEYKESLNQKVSHKGFLHYRLNYIFTDFYTHELFMQKEFDEFLLIEDRNLVGTGARLDLLSSYAADSLVSYFVNLGIGFMYEYEYFKSEPAVLTRLLRSTNYLSFSIQSGMVNFFTTVYYQPDIGDFSDFRVLNESQLEIKIYGNLSFVTNLEYRFDSAPARTVKHYDLSLTNGLSIKF